MPSQTRSRKEYGLVHFGTYGQTGTVFIAETLNESRDRVWSNSTYRTAQSRAKQLLLNGYLPTQAYSDNLQQVINSKVVAVTGQLTNDPSSTFVWRFIPGVARLSCSLTDSRVLNAQSEVLAKLQGKLSGVGVSVPLTIADAGKTASMIGQAAGRIYTAYRHVRHGNFKAAAVALNLQKVPRRVSRKRSVEDNWLEYRYGWRLVAYDITSYMKQIHRMLTERPIVYRESAMVRYNYAPYRYTIPDQFTGPSSTYYNLLTYTLQGSTTRTIQATAGYVYALESPALSLGQELGLLNLASVAWDLIPGSFMADWAVNVSSVLEGLTAFQGKKFLDGYVTLMHQTVRQESWISPRKGSTIFRLNTGAVFYSPDVVERRFSRSRLSSFQKDSLRLDFSASFQNAFDGLALIRQVFGSRRG